MIWIIGVLFILFIVANITVALAPTKFVNVDTGVFDSISYKITIYDDLETAKSKSHFKTSIYEVPEYLLDDMNKILNSQKRQRMKLNDAWCAEKFLLDKKCEIVYVNRNYF